MTPTTNNDQGGGQVPTPRTDAVVCALELPHVRGSVVPAMVCRQIEREATRLESENRALREALEPFAKVADEYDQSRLDQCRPEWGGNDEMTELLQGRGGKSLLVLRDFIKARSTLNGQPAKNE